METQTATASAGGEASSNGSVLRPKSDLDLDQATKQEVRRQDKRSRRKDKTRRRKSHFIIVPSISSMLPQRTESIFGDTDELDYGSDDDMNQPRTVVYFPAWERKKEMESPEWKDRVDDRDTSLLDPIRSWDLKVLKVLHMIRQKELTEYNPKSRLFQPTRFCEYNIALFDLDKESEVKPGPLYSQIPHSDYWKFDYSINVISIKVTQSDVPYPNKVYGTVLARDQNDYRCVYLFKRGRDDPQLITHMDDTLTLTGPYRALSGRDSMYFEFHLKILGDGVLDQDFSKGLIERNACCDNGESRTLSLESSLSTVTMLYTPIPSAVQASLEVNVLNGRSNFIGKITASTGADKNKIILYDSKVAGTELTLGSGGSVSLTGSIVAVSHNENLVLKIYVSDDSSERLKLVFGHSDEECIRTLGPYELQVKIIWTGVFRQEQPETWMKVKHTLLLA
ncbi:hypothetical protein EJB05_27566 [Eragrostis curvula]|uniref:DUF6598 domain-containing protein n=1 Tax=Eragrostis curvula TaxID=38414 RepID=A0A5J9UNE6_9POAL|nr:hypothetical protein EJB05_27566 [Eragrostis curvula]